MKDLKGAYSSATPSSMNITTVSPSEKSPQGPLFLTRYLSEEALPGAEF